MVLAALAADGMEGTVTDVVPNLAVETDTLSVTADLSVTQSDGRREVAVGQEITYDVLVRNAGPDSVDDARVTSTLPVGLTDVTFTSMTQGGAVSGTPVGGGPLADEVQLPPLSSIHYRVSGRVTDLASGVLTHSVQVVGPDGVDFVDVEPSNNVATDVDILTPLTVLGSEPTVIWSDGALEPGTTDRFKLTAHDTGLLRLTAHLSSAGDVQVAIDDKFGQQIAASDTSSDPAPLVVPVVSQQTYYVRVIGFGVDEGQELIDYDLELENFAAHVPAVIGLDPSTDSGMMDNDAITSNPRPKILIQADLEDFLAAGVSLLQPIAGEDGGSELPLAAGVAIEVAVTDLESGAQFVDYATALGLTGELFTYQPTETDSLASSNYIVTAAVRVFDGTSLQGSPAPATGRSQRSLPFRFTIDRVAPVAADRPDLLSSSDTGRSTVDDITSNSQPAFRGVGESNIKVRVFANRIGGEIEVVGQGVTNVDGSWEITVEPLDDDIYHIRAEFEDLAGNISSVGEPLRIEVDTMSPNTPYLDLLPAADAGVSSSDNTTSVSSPTFSMTTQDPRQDQHWNPFNYNYRLFLRLDAKDGQVASPEFLVYDSLADIAIPAENLQDNLTDLEQLVRTLGPYPDGVHNFKLEVEDRAGNISEDYLLSVTIDTVTPPAEFQLLSSSDTGSFDDDAVTALESPAFAGFSEVGAFVSLYADGRLVGQARVGSDASDGDPEDGLGAWEITSEPLADGSYDITVQVEDAAGNLSTGDELSVTIDTSAPNLPYLDLITDTGISDTDNITDDNTPQLTITANDTPDGGANPFPHDVKYRLYDRSGAGNEVLLVDSFLDLGGLSEDGFFTVTTPELSDGVHNLKLEVEDRAGNISPAFTLQVQIVTTPPQVGELDLADYSDSGMSETDNVTAIRQPAILGVGSIGDRVLVYANGELVGNGVVGSDVSDGEIGNGLGAWEITLEPLDDDVYEIVALVEDVAGNTVSSSPLIIEVDTLQPNTPFLDLREADDAGRHNDDNVTNAQSVVFSATTHDANSDLHLQLIPAGQNFKYRLYQRSEQDVEVLIYDSAADASLPGKLDGLIADAQLLLPPLELPENWNNLKLEVEDRAGNISEDFLLDLLVDRTPPQGTGQLHPDSDTGVPGLPDTFTDGITSLRTPTWTGTTQANALVTLSIDGVAAGTAVAVPLDGDDAVQPPDEPYNLQGNWSIRSAVGLDDGPHDVQLTFEDLAGNRSTLDLQLVIDTTGPRIVNVTRNEEGFPSLFDPKPSSGPDPLIDSLVIHLTDQPDWMGDLTEGPLATAIVNEEGNYRLVGDANGDVTITSVEVVTSLVDDDLLVTQIVLHFADPLPDDRFTLTVSDNIRDVAGNRLDGESGANGPFEGQPGLTPVIPIFPSGDGVAGGSFLARFTVDSRPELATWAAGSAWIDANGNFQFDPENVDHVNRDFVFRYGFTSDDLVAGNFALPGEVTDGYDKLAAYGRAEGQFRWLVDTDNDGVPNIDRVDPFQANALPVAGRFDADASNGDEVGLFDGKFWYFDTNHDFRTDTRLRSQLVGYPIVGDFDGDGFDDLATWADDRFMIDLAHGSLRGWDGFADEVFTFGFIGVRERPVAADMNQDGFDDFGLWVPDRDQSEWYFLISAGQSLIERFSPPDDPIDSRPVIDFTPRPFGPDLYARFGDEFALPLVGNFDPPTLSLEQQQDETSWTNSQNAYDVNGDAAVSPLDVVLVLNDLNQSGARPLQQRGAEDLYLDVNADRYLSPLDAMLVVNKLNQGNPLLAQMSTPVAARPAFDFVGGAAGAVLADQVFAEDDPMIVAEPLELIVAVPADPPTRQAAPELLLPSASSATDDTDVVGGVQRVQPNQDGDDSCSGNRA